MQRWKRGFRWLGRLGLVLAVQAVAAGAARAQLECPAVLCFDGAEPGVGPGTTSFEFAGSSWSGGVVARLFDSALYTSGLFAYVIAAPAGTGAAEVLFDPPVTDVEMAFQHGGLRANVAPGTLTSFDVDGLPIETLDSVPGQGIATPHTFLDPTIPIARIEFTGGVVDNVSFVAVPEPGGLAALLAATLALGSRRRVRSLCPDRRVRRGRRGASLESGS